MITRLVRNALKSVHTLVTDRHAGATYAVTLLELLFTRTKVFGICEMKCTYYLYIKKIIV